MLLKRKPTDREGVCVFCGSYEHAEWCFWLKLEAALQAYAGSAVAEVRREGTVVVISKDAHDKINQVLE
jgi:hypothetical protein